MKERERREREERGERARAGFLVAYPAGATRAAPNQKKKGVRVRGGACVSERACAPRPPFSSNDKKAKKIE